MRKNNQYYIRKAHRYLGLAIGIQFIFWTISGMYFSWTDIDEIHGDHFRADHMHHESKGLIGISEIDSNLVISSLSLRYISGEPYYWVNQSQLYHALTGAPKEGVSEAEARSIAMHHLKSDMEIESIELITEVDSHHEYRGRALPAYMLQFEGSDQVRAYISQADGRFQTLRHRDWRWFDFLWMTHTMDYQGRDDINNTLLRVFSLFGLVTVASGFVLFFATVRLKRRKA